MALILATNNSYFRDSPSGSSRIAYDLAHGMAKRGHRVWHLSLDIAGSKPEWETDGQVTILRYRLPTGNASRTLFRHTQHIYSAAAVLRRHLPDSPDVIHGHAPLQYLAARQVYSQRGFWCYTVHSPAVEEMRIVWANQGVVGRLKRAFGIPLIRRMEREILGSANVLAAESEYTRSLLSRSYGSKRAAMVHVIPGWVNLEDFHPLAISLADARSQLGWPLDRPVIFTLRRLEARMGLDNLLHAYALLSREGHQFHAVIGGTGSQESAMRALCNRLGLESTVAFMGRVSESMLPLAYGACDLSVIPTAALECFGLIAIEALACGRPVLVTPVGALPEVMKSFEPRWIAPSASPEGLAAAVRAYLDGALPAYNGTLVRQALQYYSLHRALRDYADCLSLPWPGPPAHRDDTPLMPSRP